MRSRRRCSSKTYPTPAAAWDSVRRRLEDRTKQKHRGRLPGSVFNCRGCNGWHHTTTEIGHLHNLDQEHR